MLEPEHDPSALPIGSLFHGRYEILRRIKAGGMGAVYEVRDTRTRRRRALKVMLPGGFANPSLRARFRLEATVAAEIDSEHVVETSDAGIDPDTGIPFIVMELLQGEDLGVTLRKRGRLQPP
jgi:serine/threonine-protein kinase